LAASTFEGLERQAETTLDKSLNLLTQDRRATFSRRRYTTYRPD